MGCCFSFSRSLLKFGQPAFGFFLEGGFENAGARRADAVGISETEFVGASAGILLNRQQRRNSAAFGVHAPDEVSRALRSNHQDINVGRRNDSFEMNAEAVREA